MCNFSHYSKCIENLRFNKFRQIQQVICFWLLVYSFFFFFVIYRLINFWNPVQMDDFTACLFLCANQWGLQNRNMKRFFIFHWVFESYQIKFTMKNHNRPKENLFLPWCCRFSVLVTIHIKLGLVLNKNIKPFLTDFYLWFSLYNELFHSFLPLSENGPQITYVRDFKAKVQYFKFWCQVRASFSSAYFIQMCCYWWINTKKNSFLEKKFFVFNFSL